MNTDAKILANRTQQHIKKSNASQSSGVHSRDTRMVQRIQINVIYHMKNLKVISIDIEKAFDKI